MKILFLMHTFLIGNSMHGVGVLTYELARQLQENHEVIVIDRAISDKFEIIKTVYREISVYRIASPLSLSNNTTLHEHGYDNNRVLELLKEIVKKEDKIDIVNIHHMLSWPNSIIDFFHKTNIPIVLSIHDTSYLCPTINYHNRIHNTLCSKELKEKTGSNCERCCQSLERYRYEQQHDVSWYRQHITSKRDYLNLSNNVCAVVFPTEKCRLAYEKEGWSHKNTKIIPYFIEVPKILKQNHNGFVFGFISNIALGKGLDVLLNAFSRLDEKDIRLKVYGEVIDKNHFNNLQKSIQLDSRIEYCGKYLMENIDQVLADIDAVVVPSTFPESFNLCSYIAVQSGIPLIVSDIAYHKEFLKDNDNCYVFLDNLQEKMLEANFERKSINVDQKQKYIFSSQYLHVYNDVHRNIRYPKCQF